MHSDAGFGFWGSNLTIDGYNLLILIGAIHGLILSLLLVSARTNRPASVLLALVLVFYTLPVLRSVLHDIGFFSESGLWFLSFEMLYGLGPALYLYATFASDPSRRFRLVELLHFAPVAAEIAYYFSPLYAQPQSYYFGYPQTVSHVVWMVEQAGAVLSLVIYLIMTNALLARYSGWVKANFSDANAKTLVWLRRPIVLYTVFFALWLTLRGIDIAFLGDNLASPAYQPLLLFLSVSTYWIGTKGFLESRVDESGFAESGAEPREDPADLAMLQPIFAELQRVMFEERLYLSNGLTLGQLSERAGLKKNDVSKAINTIGKVNFYDFVNSYRIEEFKSRASADSESGTMMELAMHCGFGSKATFNHAFKRSTGLTPSQFVGQLSATRSVPE